MMERRSGVLPAWEDCVISLPEVALHYHRREPPQVPLRELYAKGHSGATCVSPREVARWAEAVGSASVGSMVVSLKEVMEAGEWHPSPTPSTFFSSSSSLCVGSFVVGGCRREGAVVEEAVRSVTQPHVAHVR